MKKIILLLNIVALCLLAACNPNEYATFNDKDAFVAFDRSSYSISEQGGSLKVPVTLASLKGLQASVTVKSVDGTAKAGVDFNIKNNTLNFDANTRTAYAEIEIINRAGLFTGDVYFSITFDNLGELNAGNKSSVSITINDEDHPLSSILGTYSATEMDFWDTPYTWSINLVKDENDVSKVWIENLDPYFSSFGYVAAYGYNKFYGVVNSDKTEIALPLGQSMNYGSVQLFIADEDYNTINTGNLIMKIDQTAGTLKIENPWGVGVIDSWWSGFYSTTFTKQ